MNSLQQAIQDVSMIRKAIERSGSQPEKAKQAAINANIMLHAISLILVLAFIVEELLTNNSTTKIILFAQYFRQVRVMGLITVGATLPLLLLGLYFIVWRSSVHGEQDFSSFVSANFRYLRSLSLIADLLVKFVVLALLLYGGHPEWIGAVLALYTADYLFQGRFFNFSIRTSLVLGFMGLLLSGLLVATDTPLLIWPFVFFGGLNILSLGGLFLAKRASSGSAVA